MNDNWQEVKVDEAIQLCERSGFSCREIDPFAMEIKDYVLPGTRVEFKYQIRNSDPVKFFIWPKVDGKDVMLDEFKEVLKKAKKK